MQSKEYTPAELLVILKKVWPDAYRHVVWMIRTFLRLNETR